MKTSKICDIVLLPAKRNSEIWLMHNRKQGLMNLKTASTLDGTPQYLYIVSDEEIKEGDWVCEITGECPSFSDSSPRIKQSYKGYYNNGTWRKIIASTDPKLLIYEGSVVGYRGLEEQEADKYFPLPQIPQSFILLYIEEYNAGRKIEKIEVEYEIVKAPFEDEDNPADITFKKEILKVNSDNTISIRLNETDYTKELLQDIISWEKDLSEYESLESVLREKYIIQKRL